MKTDEVRLRVVKHTAAKKAPPAVLPKPKSHAPVKPSPLTLSTLTADLESPKSSPDDTSTPLDRQSQSSSNDNVLSSPSDTPQSPTKLPSGPQSPFKKTPPIPPQRHPSTTLTNSTSPTSSNVNKPRKIIIAPTNTKKIGKRIEIQLVKGNLFFYHEILYTGVTFIQFEQKSFLCLHMLCLCCNLLMFLWKNHSVMFMHMSPVKRICVFEYSVMTNFNCACPAIQRDQGSGFLSEGSS